MERPGEQPFLNMYVTRTFWSTLESTFSFFRNVASASLIAKISGTCSGKRFPTGFRAMKTEVRLITLLLKL
jgi:hypothetical protein